MTPAPNPASTQAFPGAEADMSPAGNAAGPTPHADAAAGLHAGDSAVPARFADAPAGAVALHAGDGAEPARYADAGAAGVAADGSVPPAFLAPSYAEPRKGRVGRAYLRMLERVPGWLAPLAVLGCIGGAVGYTLITNPTDSAPDAPPTCILKLTTGLDCPGCGGTRAAWYLLHGDVAAAARHHLVFVFAVPFVVYLYIAWAAKRSFGWKLPQLRIPPVALAIFMGAWLAFSVLRNLPWAPFNWFYV
ncbi:DUF2752 domain-containing protein [Asanoa sp. NPDC049573]|uniref:DUF2752 domain-containing protein n=1 Tax=Asanoa sp. NPDC049573 TaxID=3155396 RepID=UPI0034368C36